MHWFPHMHLFLFCQPTCALENLMNKATLNFKRKVWISISHWIWGGKYDQCVYFCEQKLGFFNRLFSHRFLQKDAEYCRNKSILYVGSTNVSEENDQDFKSCKCRFQSSKYIRDDKPAPWEETLTYLPEMWGHAALLTASPGYHNWRRLPPWLEV